MLPKSVFALVACVVLSSVYGFMYAWSVFVLPIEETFGWTRAMTSFTYTLMLTSFSVGMFTGGLISDRIGSKITTIIGGCFLSIGLYACAHVSSITMLYVYYGIFVGLGMGMGNVAPFNVGMQNFPKRKGLVTGVTTMALAIGTLVYGSVLASFLIDYKGLEYTFKFLSVLFIIIVLVASQFLFIPKTLSNNSVSLKGETLAQALKSLKFWLIWLWLFSMQTGGLMTIGHIVPYVQNVGFSPALGALIMGIYALSNAVGRPLAGLLFDRVGYAKSMKITPVCLAIGLLCLAFIPSIMGLPGVIGSVVIIALSVGGSVPQWSSLTMIFFGSKHFGAILGFSSTSLVAAAFLGPYIGGLAYTINNSYFVAIILSVMIALLGILIVYLIQYFYGKNIIKSN